MPNIELHGFSVDEQNKAFEKIKEALQADDPTDLPVITVVTFCADICLNMKGKPYKYIRILSDSYDYNWRLEDLLRQLGFECRIEIVALVDRPD